MPTTLRQRLRRARPAALVVAFAACCGMIAAATSAAAAPATWTPGACTASDRARVTVVIDFQRLDGNDGRAAPTIVRCVTPPSAGTGIDVLRAAGVRLTGVGRDASASTDIAFVCRIEGRPTADEPLDPGSGGEPHRETCLATPPTTAYWSYWHAPRLGAAWTYNALGAASRTPSGGEVEGWSFMLGDGARPVPPERPPAASERVPPDPAPLPRSEPAPLPAPATAAPPVRRSAAPVRSAAAASPRTPTPRAPAPARAETRAPIGSASATWLAGELDGGMLPGPAGGPDLGLTIDALFALRAAGAHEQAAATIADALQRRTAEAVDEHGPDGRMPDAGLLAKLLTAMTVAGVDPTDVAGVDLRATVTAASATTDELTTFDRSFVLLGLARSGGDATEPTSALLELQCRSGWFRLERSAGCTPDLADTDATAIAIQALAAAERAGDARARRALARAAGWLVAQQRSDGSLGGGPSTEASNANSTGLAAQAFDAARRPGPASRARSWVTLLVADGSIDDLAGAIAYDPATLAAARTDGVSRAQRDQWRRSTAQALFALAPVSLHRLGGTPLPAAVVDDDAENIGATNASASETSSGGRHGRRSWTLLVVAMLAGALLGALALRRLHTTSREES